MSITRIALIAATLGAAAAQLPAVAEAREPHHGGSGGHRGGGAYWGGGHHGGGPHASGGHRGGGHRGGYHGGGWGYAAPRVGIYVAPPLFAAPPVYGYVPPPVPYGYATPSYGLGQPGYAPSYDPGQPGYAPPYGAAPQGYAGQGYAGQGYMPPADPYAASIATGGAKW